MQDEDVVGQVEAARTERQVAGRRWVRWLPSVFLALAVVAAVSGSVYWLADRPSSNTVEIYLATPTPEPPMVVHVAGAVVSPGVYSLEPASRVGDAIAVAGGALPNADIDALNLAAVVTDGQRIEVTFGSAPDAAMPSTGDGTGANVIVSPVSGLIDLNTADQSTLETLPNIGEVRARAIIDWRETNGPFESLDSLRDVPGIGPETVSGIRGLVVPG